MPDGRTATRAGGRACPTVTRGHWQVTWGWPTIDSSIDERQIYWLWFRRHVGVLRCGGSSDAAERLREVVAESVFGLVKEVVRSGRQIVGKVRTDAFRAERISRVGDSFRPRLVGTIHEEPGGCSIRIYFRCSLIGGSSRGSGGRSGPAGCCWPRLGSGIGIVTGETGEVSQMGQGGPDAAWAGRGRWGGLAGRGGITGRGPGVAGHGDLPAVVPEIVTTVKHAGAWKNPHR